MISTNLHDPPEFTSFKVFQFLGYFIGGLAPVFLFLGIEVSGYDQNLIHHNCVGRFFLVAILGVIIGFVAFFIEHKFSEDNFWFKFFFTIQALYSIFLIHTIVIYTGGPKSSVFSASYLYLIAIVGYTFGHGFKLYGAALFLFISYFINLGYAEQQKVFFNDLFFSAESVFKDSNGIVYGGKHDIYIYGIIFILQIFVTVSIASKRIPKQKNVKP